MPIFPATNTPRGRQKLCPLLQQQIPLGDGGSHAQFSSNICNETADLLAKCGKCKPIGTYKFPVPSSFITSIIKNCYQISETTLQNLPLSSEAKHITHKFLESGKFKPSKISKHITKLRPQDLSVLIRALSDVNCLNYHMYKIGYSFTPHCEFCEDNDETEIDGSTPLETVSHILFQCPKYIQTRADIYNERFPDENKMVNKGIHHRHNAKRLINFFNKTKCLSRKPKLSKADISPNRTYKGRKRKKTCQLQSNPNNPPKQTKLTHFLTGQPNPQNINHN